MTASSPRMPLGTIGWIDLTATDATGLRDFYSKVIGWETEPVGVGDYEDFCVGPSGSAPVAGICHAKGPNVGIPPVWLIYFTVANAEHAAQEAVKHGGTVVRPVSTLSGTGRFVVLRDPAGATFAAFEQHG